jgi:hypothetical protein
MLPFVVFLNIKNHHFIIPMNLNIINLQGTIFLSDFSISDRLSLINFFDDITSNKFDGEVFSLPIPQDTPIGFPRIILNSKDALWKTELTLEPLNIIFSKPAN